MDFFVSIFFEHVVVRLKMLVFVIFTQRKLGKKIHRVIYFLHIFKARKICS